MDYSPKMLRVNLNTRTSEIEELDPALARKFIGGVGLAAKILWDNTSASTAALAPESPLLFFVGPLTGLTPDSSRYAVVGISPVTGIWGNAYGGGRWGWVLSQTGLSGIMVEGRSDKPVYLLIEDGRLQFRDASHVWGKDTYETDEVLRQETDGKASVLAIGRAGERLVNMAAIVSDGKLAGVAARCGLGAVMGSKALKAIVVKGSKKPQAADPAALKTSIAKNFPVVAPNPEKLHEALNHTFGGMLDKAHIQNFRLDRFDSLRDAGLKAMLRAEVDYCAGCRHGCFGHTKLQGERYFHAEHYCPVGANSLVDNTDALLEAYRMINRYGMDTIAVGGTIGFAMECYEKGLITKADTGGLELTWGNHQVLLELVRQIGEAEGFGKLLGQGSKAVADQIGGLAHEYALETKGLEFPLFDQRINNGWALQHALSSRGADHCDAYTGLFTRNSEPPFGAEFLDEEGRAAYGNPLAVKGIGQLVARSQDFDSVVDSLIVCKFMFSARIWMRRAPESYEGMKLPVLLEWLNAITGWGLTPAELMEAGERISTLRRIFNVRRGISRKDDTLPSRLLTTKRGGTTDAGNNLPPLGVLLNQFYDFRSWSEEGIPVRGKLADLQLKQEAEELAIALPAFNQLKG